MKRALILAMAAIAILPATAQLKVIGIELNPGTSIEAGTNFVITTN